MEAGRDRPLRVLYITSTIPYSNAESFIIAELAELRRRGVELCIAPLKPKGWDVQPDAAPLIPFTVGRPLLSLSVLAGAVAECVRAPARTLRAAGWVLRSRSPWVLLKNLAVFPKGLWTARLARRWGAEHIHVHWASTSSTAALIAAEVSGIPWSMTAHRWDIAENNLLQKKIDHARFARFIAEDSLAMARKVAPDVPDSRALVIHMGVVLPGEPAAGHGCGETTATVALCPAGLQRVKGHRYLIDAMAILKERGVRTELWLAGEGDIRSELESQVERLGLRDRVRFLGFVPHSELMELLHDPRIAMVVLSSIDLGFGWSEGIPVSLMEAMARAMPVIATQTGAIPELVGGVGILVPPEDSTCLAEAMERLAADADLRSQLGELGRQRVVREFAVEPCVGRLLEMFMRAARR